MPRLGQALPGISSGSLNFYNNSLYLFGYPWSVTGSVPVGSFFYSYDLIRESWNTVNIVSGIPENRKYHSSAVYNDALFIFYGVVIEINEQLNSIWKFNFLSNEWKMISSIVGDEMANSDMAQDGAILYSVCGRSLSYSNNSIFYFDLSENIPARTMLAQNWDSPAKRKNHCSVVVNDRIIIFGGISDSGDHLNDVWYFDITLNAWNYVVATGEIPAARELAGCASPYNNSLIIFGGTDMVNIYNDIFYFDPYLSYWKQINSYSEVMPSPRYSSCVIFSQGSLLIFGGQNNMKIFDEFWMHDYINSYFSVINSNDNVRINLVDYKCWIDKDNQNIMYILGGMASNYKSSTSLYQVALLQENGEYKSKTTLLNETLFPIPTEAPLVIDGYFAYVIFGSYWRKFTVSRILILNYKTMEQYFIELDAELALYGHTAVHYGDSLYIIGGSSSVGSMKIGFIPNNQIYKLTRNKNNVVYIGCSIETIEPACTPCPMGYINQNSQCVPCPPGTYSTLIGSITYFQCTHCAFGTYNSKSGQTYCIDCPARQYCPIGATSPIEQAVVQVYQSIQPSAYAGKSTEISNLVSELWYLVFAIFASFILIAVTYRDILDKVKAADLLVNQHDQELNIPVIYRKTQIGGLFSIFFLLSAGMIIIGSFLTYYFDNITENKSLVPILLLENSISASIVQVTISFYLYGGLCVQNSTCQPENVFADSNIKYSSRDIICSKTGTTCNVILTYTDFSISSNSALYIQMIESIASATSMSVNITSTSSIPDQISSVFLPISTGSGLFVFLGMTPTVVTYEFTPSVLYIQIFFSASSEWPSQLTGYHLSVDKNVTLGSLQTQQT